MWHTTSIAIGNPILTSFLNCDFQHCWSDSNFILNVQQQQQSLLAFPFNTVIAHIKITIAIIHSITFLHIHKFVFLKKK